MASFGDGLGQLIGGIGASNAISAGSNTVRGLGGQAYQVTSPFIGFGQSLLPTAGSAIGNVMGAAGDTPQFSDFMQDFSLSPGAQYEMGQALEGADTSAAARGSLLSGANLRAREEIAAGITSKDMASQYGMTLAGDQQAFGQLLGAAGTALGGVGVGSSAANTYVGALTSQMSSQAQLAAAQAKASSGKGGGIGSMLSGIGGIAAKF